MQLLRQKMITYTSIFAIEQLVVQLLRLRIHSDNHWWQRFGTVASIVHSLYNTQITFIFRFDNIELIALNQRMWFKVI